CFVTRGPGATNASHGVHIAAHDSTPLILMIGQVQRGARDREAFQEIDYRRFFGGIAKWVAEIDDPARLPEYISQAYHTAMAGRPGPVVLALPEDVLSAQARAPAAAAARGAEIHPGAEDMATLGALLQKAERPIAILGGSRWSERAVADFAHFAERFDLPVGCSFRRQALFDNRHLNYAGDVGIGINPKLAARIKAADLILLVGGRMSEMPSSRYTLLDIPEPKQALVHVHPGAEELGRVYRPVLGIQASPGPFTAALGHIEAPTEPAWRGWTREAHADYCGWSEKTPQNPGPVQMGEIMRYLRETLPEDSIIGNGAGNFATWLHRFYRYRRFGTQLGPVTGSMGYGLPAAIAAKRLHPDRMVLAWTGDGDFLMTGQDFATAVKYKLGVIVILIDNGLYGTIAMHQQRDYPGREIATELANPDFAVLAAAYGGLGEKVMRTDDFAPAFDRAKAAADAGTPALLHVVIDPETIAPTTTLSTIREAALRRRNS
ncbi:MAG: thiamine pyrophosphate-binding protein, partial [Hyphomicrobiales bacterium]|nr:thiamine pyrophosphate-binding protein [Hyphomicrobiales bacterium]